MREDEDKVRILLVVEKERLALLRQVLNYPWLRLVELSDWTGEPGYPTPPGKRLVSDAAWEVLRRGAQIPSKDIRKSLAMLGTQLLAEEHRGPGERWSVAELARRELEEENFER